MRDYNLLYALLFAILGTVGWAGWTLRRILRIMIMQNRGIPAVSELASMSLEEMAKRKK